jgi:hypothetical protein
VNQKIHHGYVSSVLLIGMPGENCTAPRAISESLQPLIRWDCARQR